VDPKGEIPLQGYEALKKPGSFSEEFLTKVLRGISLQRYGETVIEAEPGPLGSHQVTEGGFEEMKRGPHKISTKKLTSSQALYLSPSLAFLKTLLWLHLLWHSYVSFTMISFYSS